MKKAGQKSLGTRLAWTHSHRIGTEVYPKSCQFPYFRTPPFSTVPEAIPNALLFEIDQEADTIHMDWSQTFRLNGRLRHFVLVRNDIMLLQTLDLQVTLTNEPVGERKWLMAALRLSYTNSSKKLHIPVNCSMPSSSYNLFSILLHSFYSILHSTSFILYPPFYFLHSSLFSTLLF